MARNSSGGGLWVLLGALALIFMVPKEVWIAIGVLGGTALIAFLIIKHLNSKNSVPPDVIGKNEPTLAELMAPPRPKLSPKDPKRPVPPQPAGSSSLGATRSRTVGGREPDAAGAQTDEFYVAAVAAQKAASSYAMPKAPTGFGDGRWVTPGEEVTVAGVNLPGGMIYVGGRLKAPNGDTDPCLISGQLNVAQVGNYRTRQMGYWPSYAEASPTERRAYLNWLAEGRGHPDCDIGYVFLFFYGLERRVIVDSRTDPAAKKDWPAIIQEIRRLLAIYGEKSGSFKRYAGELLSWIELDGSSGQLYSQAIPDFPRTYELPPYIRLALGQAAVDRAPVPAQLALAWVRLEGVQNSV